MFSSQKLIPLNLPLLFKHPGVWADEEEEYEELNKNKKELKGINFVTSKSSSIGGDNLKIERDEELARPTFSGSSSGGSSKWKRPSEDLNQIAGFRNDRSKLRAFDSKFCEFENSTRGIGSKLLLNMGFVPGKASTC